ncbi:hypothetical protein N9O57_01280 [bacterium]|nr:hypothetical protein [bacterium]
MEKKSNLKLKIATEALSLIFSLGICSTVWAISLYFIFYLYSSAYYFALIFVPLFSCLLYIGMIFTLRCLLPRVRPGRYIIGKDSMSLIWFLHMNLNRSAKAVGLLQIIKSSNILKYLFYKALGAKIAYATNFSMDLEIADPQLTRIDEDVIIGGQCYLGGHIVEGNKLILGPIHLKKSSFVSFRCIIGPGSILEEGSVVGPGNSVHKRTVKKGEKIPTLAWAGGPPRAESSVPRTQETSNVHH